MRRAARGLLALALVAPPAAARAEDAPPQRTHAAYAGTLAILGGIGGGALGAALGGLSRPVGGSRVTPYLRWGAAGAAFGALLGYDAGREATTRAVALADREPTTGTRSTGACLGALLGEAAGLAAGAALSKTVTRESREVWAGVALGAVVGAGTGFLLRPSRLMAPPPKTSERRAALETEMRQIAPARPLPEDSDAFRERPASDPGPIAPPAGADALARLDTRLIEAERPRLAVAPPPLTHRRAEPLEPSFGHPDKYRAMERSLGVLALLEGAALGGAAAAASGPGGGEDGRLALGIGLGALAGFSAAAALTRDWDVPERGGPDPGLVRLQHRRLAGIFAGGLLGTLLGAGTGLILANTTGGFGESDVALAAAGGNALGLLLGYVLSAPDDVAD